MARTDFIGVVCGLKSEASAVKFACDTERLKVGVTGANARKAERIATQFCEDGAVAILSIGVSGGLDPGLRPGDLLYSDKVVCIGPDGAPELLGGASPLSNALQETDLIAGLIYGSDGIIADIAEKERLFREHAAIAVDMESHGAAQAASAHGVPFIAIRAIADPAERTLPKAALGAVKEDGSTDVLRVLTTVVKNLPSAPSQLAALGKLGVDARAADQRMRLALGPILRSLLLRLDLG
ncbi:MAG: hypothetical protein AAF850_08405 [Pseudomonadota bacterium]